MLDFLKKAFGGSGNAQQERRLTHPRDLRQGDIVKFAYNALDDISGKQFEVETVNTYLYGNWAYPELVLKDDTGNVVFMMLEEEDGEAYLGISKKIPKNIAHALIPTDVLNDITSGNRDARLTIDTPPPGYQGWLKNKYRFDESIRGEFIVGDARFTPHAELKQRAKFTSYTLLHKSDEFALEIENYKGEFELCATVYLDLNEIDEMWPGNTNTGYNNARDGHRDDRSAGSYPSV